MGSNSKSSSDVVNKPVTYVGIASAWTPPATPTDMVTLRGKAGVIVRVLAVIITGTQTTAGINTIILIKRSTLDTAGTSVADTAVALDSGDASSSGAVLEHWTANPTLGTSLGKVAAENLLCPAPAGTSNDRIVWIFNGATNKELLLKSATEQLAVNFNGAALPAGLSLNVEIVWTEE